MNGTRFTPILHYLRRLTGSAAVGGHTDEQLLSRFIAQRDETAFAALVQRHGPLVWGVCRRSLADLHAAEDAFQATFLVLARRAAAIVKRASVRSWLHGVACRIAQRARERGRREQARLAAIDPVQLAAPSDADAWRQLQPILDEELDRLPDKYRAPLLLCYLEGKTRDEAAQELGWTEGAVKGRLERGRDLLRERLARRGLGLTAALLSGLLATGATAAVPPSLATSTVQAALGSAVSAPVAELVKGALQMMFWVKLKVAVLAVLMLTMTGVGVGLAFHHSSSTAVKAPLPEGVTGKPAGSAGQAALTDEQMAALAKETAHKGGYVDVELQEIRSLRLLEQPFKQTRFWCVLKGPSRALPRLRFLAVNRAGKVSDPFEHENFAAVCLAEDRSKWTDAQYQQAAALCIHLMGTQHQYGWKVLDTADDFMATTFNMFPQNEKKRADAAKLIEKPKIVKDRDTVQVRLWAWHRMGGALLEWTVEFKPTDVKATSKEHGRFGGGGYD